MHFYLPNIHVLTNPLSLSNLTLAHMSLESRPRPPQAVSMRAGVLYGV